MIEQGVVGIAAFDVVSTKIDNIAKLPYFLTTTRILVDKGLTNNRKSILTRYNNVVGICGFQTLKAFRHTGISGT
jgi:hypothetical protein